MRPALTIALCALMLAGCADSYDRAAMPGATAILNQQTVRCKARWTAKEFTTYSQWQACQLEAERAFAVAVKLKMDVFETYAAGMQALAADRDAKRVTDRQVRSRAELIHWTFLADCQCKPEPKPSMAYGQIHLAPMLGPRLPAMIPMTP